MRGIGSIKGAAVAVAALIAVIGQPSSVWAQEAASSDAPHIAGVEPSVRPAWAPVLDAVNHDSEWYARALTGIESPFPASLRFLEDQGNWYQPFIRPGMTGPYDLRGWHSQ